MSDNQEKITYAVSKLVNNPNDSDTIGFLISLIAERKEEDLNLSGLGISPVVIGIIAQAIAKNPNLKELDLCDNNIGAEGTKALAKELAKNPNLTVLKLSENEIGADGAEALAKALAKNTNLKELDFVIIIR